jgi:hypothetical protein
MQSLRTSQNTRISERAIDARYVAAQSCRWNGERCLIVEKRSHQYARFLLREW